MAILSVRRYGDPILRQKATPVAKSTKASGIARYSMRFSLGVRPGTMKAMSW